VAATVVPASIHDNEATAAVLEEAGWWGTTERLELVLVDRGVTQRAVQRLGAATGVEVRRVGWVEPQLDDDGRRVFHPIGHAWRVEVGDGRIGRARRLVKSNEPTNASASAVVRRPCHAGHVTSAALTGGHKPGAQTPRIRRFAAVLNGQGRPQTGGIPGIRTTASTSEHCS